jgi:hypothetical protein
MNNGTNTAGISNINTNDIVAAIPVPSPGKQDKNLIKSFILLFIIFIVIIIRVA